MTFKNDFFASPEGKDLPGTLEMTATQRRMWWINEVDANALAFNIPILLNWNTEDLGVLNRVTELLSRLTFCRYRLQTSPALKWRRDESSTIPVIRHDSTDSDLNAMHLAALYHFDLTVDNPIRVHWFKRSDNQHQVLFIFSHIVFDGSSVVSILNALNPQKKVDEDQLSVNMIEDHFLALQQEAIEHPSRDEYWIALAGQCAATLFDRDGSTEESSGKVEIFDLSRKQIRSLKDEAKRCGRSLSSHLAIRWMRTLFHFSDHDRISLGSISDGRSALSRHSIGNFATAFPLLVSREEVDSLIIDYADIAKFPFLPFDRMIESLPHDQKRLFDVFFGFHIWPGDTFNLLGANCRVERFYLPLCRYPLACDVILSKNRFAVKLESKYPKLLPKKIFEEVFCKPIG